MNVGAVFWLSFGSHCSAPDILGPCPGPSLLLPGLHVKKTISGLSLQELESGTQGVHVAVWLLPLRGSGMLSLGSMRVQNDHMDPLGRFPNRLLKPGGTPTSIQKPS